jgi:hypothetical protein
MIEITEVIRYFDLCEKSSGGHNQECYKVALAALKTVEWVMEQTPHTQIHSGLDAISIMAIRLKFEKLVEDK